MLCGKRLEGKLMCEVRTNHWTRYEVEVGTVLINYCTNPAVRAHGEC